MGDYRDLRAWQAADRLAHSVFNLAEQHWRPQDATIYDQLRRAALSVPLNLAEGHACGPGKRFRWHLGVAYGSAVETEAILRFLLARGVTVDGMLQQVSSVRALVYRLRERTPPE